MLFGLQTRKSIMQFSKTIGFWNTENALHFRLFRLIFSFSSTPKSLENKKLWRLIKMNNESNIQISLNDFESHNIFVLLESYYKKNLLTTAINRAGSQSKLANTINHNITYDVKQSDISRFMFQKNLRLDLVYWLSEFTNIKFDNSKILGFKGTKTSEMIYHPNLSIPLSKELAQILANLYCDGSIEESNCYVSTYCNSYRALIERFKNNFRECFGQIDFYERSTSVIDIRIPCFIGRLLCQKFKINDDRVPTQIINSSAEIKSAYLQAVFDDEGSIHNGHGQIRIKMKPKSYIEDIHKLVNEFNIETSKVIKEHDKRNGRDHYYFLISGMYNIKKFHDKIGFFHPKKNKMILSHIQNIKTENYGYKARNLVLDVLKKNESLTAKQIAVILNRDRRIVHQHLTNLKKQNLVDYTKIKRKFVYEYLWKAIKLTDSIKKL